MFIVDSLRSEVVNVDNVTSICFGRKGDSIIANMINGEEITLGCYDNTERTFEVFNQMLNTVFPDTVLKMKEFEKDRMKALSEAWEKEGFLRKETLENLPSEAIIHDVKAFYMPEE